MRRFLISVICGMFIASSALIVYADYSRDAMMSHAVEKATPCDAEKRYDEAVVVDAEADLMGKEGRNISTAVKQSNFERLMDQIVKDTEPES